MSQEETEELCILGTDRVGLEVASEVEHLDVSELVGCEEHRYVCDIDVEICYFQNSEVCLINQDVVENESLGLVIDEPRLRS